MLQSGSSFHNAYSFFPVALFSPSLRIPLGANTCFFMGSQLQGTLSIQQQYLFRSICLDGGVSAAHFASWTLPGPITVTSPGQPIGTPEYQGESHTELPMQSDDEVELRLGAADLDYAEPRLPRRRKNLFTTNEQKLLLTILQRCPDFPHIKGMVDWHSVAEELNSTCSRGKTNKQCAQQFYRVLDPLKSKSRWTHGNSLYCFLVSVFTAAPTSLR